jgi:hypothetical protein
MDQRIINLYDRFTHGLINRRAFLDRLGELAGSAAAAAALLPLCRTTRPRPPRSHRTTCGSCPTS